MAPLHKLGALSMCSLSVVTNAFSGDVSGDHFSMYSDNFSGSNDFSGMSGYSNDMMSAGYSVIMSDHYSSRMSGDYSGMSGEYSGSMSASYSSIMSDDFSSSMSVDYSGMMSTDDFSGMSGTYSSNDFSGMSGEYSDTTSAGYSDIMSDHYSSRMSGDYSGMSSEYSGSMSGDYSGIMSDDYSSSMSGDYSGMSSEYSDRMSDDYVLSSDYSMSSDYSVIFETPTGSPTNMPTVKPTAMPTVMPTVSPTTIPTHAPTAKPTVAPTAKPTVAPTIAPSMSPTFSPSTRYPSGAPTSVPTSIYDTLEPTERTTSCYSDCTYPGMTVAPANWGEEEYCAFYETTGCSKELVAAADCMPSCLSDCIDVYCDSMSTLVYACDSSSDATYADKTRLENQCLDSNAANVETETVMTFDTTSTFDGVSADEMRNDKISQDAAIAAMSLSVSGIPANQITIKNITDSARRRLQGDVQRRLAGGAVVVFTILAKLEELGFSSTDSEAAFASLTNQISESVSSGAFQQNLKASGQSLGVTTFATASVTKVPTFSEPVVVALVTASPTPAPSMAPTSIKNRSGGGDDDESLSGGVVAAIVICSIVGCCCIIVLFFAINKKKREDLEEQFKQHNFLSRSSSKDVSKKSAAGGPSVKSFDSNDEQQGPRGKGASPDDMEVELESRPFNEETRPNKSV